MKKVLFLLLLPLMFLSSCYYYPDELTEAENQLVAFTQVNENFVFSACNTFAVVDSITKIEIDANGTSTTSKLTDTKSQQIRSTVIQNMENRGFTLFEGEITDNNQPDLVINISQVENMYVSASAYGWWYDYYFYDPWSYYWGYDFYYPYYYPATYSVYYTSYTAETLILEMASKPVNNKIYNCWLGLVRGIDNENTKELLDYVNQCFIQTPEIQK